MERQTLLSFKDHRPDINDRYFYDKFEEKCVKFGGCADMDNSENNFETRQDCITTCIGKLEQYKVIFRENFNILFQEKDPQMTLQTPCQM